MLHGIRMMMRKIVSVIVTGAPTSQDQTNTTAIFTFTGITITVVGGTATSYTWSIINVSGGTWSVASGAGTATAAARVSGTVAAEVHTATFRCEVVVGGITYTVDTPHTYTRS